MKKPLLILQRHDFIVENSSVNVKEGTMLLEGTFAVFGKTNSNQRIYEYSEYLPHLSYLQEKAKRCKLYGETDHPDRFDVKISKASHLVESVWYDQTTNTIKGKVKLLNTKYGRHIKGIIESGGVVSISSRSAGSVNESTRKVSIKRIFTYDFVGEGGFGNSAELTLVNEKLNINESNVDVYEVSDKFISKTRDAETRTFLNEMLVELNQGNQEVLNEIKYIDKDLNKQNENKMPENYVTTKQLKGYSEMVKKSFDSLQKKVDNLSSSETRKPVLEKYNNLSSEINKIIDYTDHIAENFNEKETTIEKLKDFVNYLAENLNKVINYSDYLGSTIGLDVAKLKEENRKLIDYTNYLGENVNNNIKYSEYLSEGLNNIVSHNDYLAENINKSIQYSEYLGEHLNNNIQYSEYLGKNVDKSIQYTEYVAEQVENSIHYSEYLGEQLNNNIQYSDYLGDNLNKSIEYSNYVSENLDHSIKYTEYVAENSLPSLPGRNKGGENLSEEINSFLSAVEKSKTEISKSKHLTSYLTESNQIKFNNLNETDKQKVLNAVLENKCQTESDVMKVWEQVLLTPERARLKFIFEHMPASVKAGWDNLDQAKKHKILESSKYYDLSSSIKVKDFWMKSGLIQPTNPLSKINESMVQSELYNSNKKSKDTTTLLGYSMDNYRNIKF